LTEFQRIRSLPDMKYYTVYEFINDFIEDHKKRNKSENEVITTKKSKKNKKKKTSNVDNPVNVNVKNENVQGIRAGCSCTVDEIKSLDSLCESCFPPLKSVSVFLEKNDNNPFWQVYCPIYMPKILYWPNNPAKIRIKKEKFRERKAICKCSVNETKSRHDINDMKKSYALPHLSKCPLAANSCATKIRKTKSIVKLTKQESCNRVQEMKGRHDNNFMKKSYALQPFRKCSITSKFWETKRKLKSISILNKNDNRNYSNSDSIIDSKFLDIQTVNCRRMQKAIDKYKNDYISSLYNMFRIQIRRDTNKKYESKRKRKRKPKHNRLQNFNRTNFKFIINQKSPHSPTVNLTNRFNLGFHH